MMHCKRYTRVTSTNDRAREFLSDPEWTVIVSQTQSKARGRRQREWKAQKGGLYLSVLLKPPHSQRSHLLTFSAASAIVHTIADLTDLTATIKWPNDVLINGKKVCGILTEAVLTATPTFIVGVGLNVNQQRFSPEFTATSLRLESGMELQLGHVEKIFLRHMKTYYRLYCSKDFSSLMDIWKESDITLGKKITVLTQQETFQGIATSVDTHGHLIVNTSNGKKEVREGDVSIRFLDYGGKTFSV